MRRQLACPELSVHMQWSTPGSQYAKLERLMHSDAAKVTVHSSRRYLLRSW